MILLSSGSIYTQRLAHLLLQEAERAIRPYVIWRNTSFFSQSYRGDQFRPLILSIPETCKRLGIHAYPVLSKACEQGLRGEKVTVRLPLPGPTPLLI